MDDLLEREIKWEVDERFVLPRIDDIVDGGNVEQATVELSSTYYDTADRDLQTHGVLLRRDDSGWRLEVPDERIEIHARPSEGPPSELTEMLTGLRLGKPLIGVATIRTVRDRYRITDPKRERLCAEVDDDRVQASVGHRLLAWREIDVELGVAARSLPRLLAQRLEEAGAHVRVRVSVQTGPRVTANPHRTAGRNVGAPRTRGIPDRTDRRHLRGRPRPAPRARSDP